MGSRLIRLLDDPEYRAHMREEAKLFQRYPRAIGYKSAALLLNRGRKIRGRLHNSHRVKCTVCGWTGNAFDAIATFGYWRRNARCPGCGCLERHRAMIEFANMDEVERRKGALQSLLRQWVRYV